MAAELDTDRIAAEVSALLEAIQRTGPITEASVSPVYYFDGRWRCTVSVNRTWASAPRFVAKDDAEAYREAAQTALERAA